jgi:hypothetical protein
MWLFAQLDLQHNMSYIHSNTDSLINTLTKISKGQWSITDKYKWVFLDLLHKGWDEPKHKEGEPCSTTPVS